MKSEIQVLDFRQALEYALQQIQAGRFSEAEQICHKLLQLDPNQAEAWHLSGVIARKCGKHELAIELALKAVQIDPFRSDYQDSLGIALIVLGRVEEAERSFRQSVALNSDSAEAHNNLGNALDELGQTENAERSYRQALLLRPEYPEALNNLGVVLKKLGRLEDAEHSYRQALAFRPRFAEAVNNLGAVLMLLGRPDDAVRSHRDALVLKPDYAEAHNNLGIALSSLGRLGEAECSYRQAISNNPGLADAHNNLGTALTNQGRREDAERSFRQATALRPDFAEAHCNLGDTLTDLGRLEEAVECYRRAIACKPGLANAHNNLGNALKELRLLEDAEQSYRQAIACNTHFVEAYNNMGSVLMDLGKLDAAERSFRHALALAPDKAFVRSNLLLLLNYVYGRGSDEIFTEHCDYGNRYRNLLNPLAHAVSRDGNRKLRVGYVSGDFRQHVIAFFIEPVLAGHDQGAFETFCYYNFPRSDEVTQRMRSYATHWRDVDALNDEALESQIRRDAIDILVDLSGHTARNRLGVFARKPAPVQASYLGYPSTTGLDTMDYRLTDSMTDPIGESDRWFTERLVRLPDAMWCYRPSAILPSVSPAPFIRNGFVTFGSLNSCVKLNAEVIAVWARLLQRVANARLVASTIPGEQARNALRKTFASLGIAAERLDLYDRLPSERVDELFSAIDIALDPFPYGGTTTTCEAMWMGIPVITWAGASTPSRSSASLLRIVGLGDLVANNIDQYLDIAERLARDPACLESLRESLRARLRASPLMDEARFVRNLERVYQAMWRSWCENAHL